MAGNNPVIIPMLSTEAIVGSRLDHVPPASPSELKVVVVPWQMFCVPDKFPAFGGTFMVKVIGVRTAVTHVPLFPCA